jgi:hypothetical protein
MPSSAVKNRDPFYNYVPTGQHSDNGYDPFREQDLAVATFMMKVVENHFPGHFWVAESDAAHNRCHIKLPMLMGNWGYQFRVTDLMEADGPKYVMRGAGELLERFRRLGNAVLVASHSFWEGVDVRGEPDLSPQDERWLGEWALAEHGSDFLYVTGYPMRKRPFYVYPDPARLDRWSRTPSSPAMVALVIARQKRLRSVRSPGLRCPRPAR